VTRTTHTYVLLELSRAAYDEIARKMREAGYDQAFDAEGEIDMRGIAVTREPTQLPVNFLLNGRKIASPVASLTYEELVTMAGKTGNPSMTVFDKKSGRGFAPHTGKVIELVEGMVINCVHTGNA